MNTNAQYIISIAQIWTQRQKNNNTRQKERVTLVEKWRMRLLTRIEVNLEADRILLSAFLLFFEVLFFCFQFGIWRCVCVVRVSRLDDNKSKRRDAGTGWTIQRGTTNYVFSQRNLWCGLRVTLLWSLVFIVLWRLGGF